MRQRTKSSSDKQIGFKTPVVNIRHKNEFFVCLLLLFSFTLFGQTYKKAEVAEVRFLCKTGSYVDTSTFPFYFHHKEFVADILGDIEKYAIDRFGVKEVGFDVPDSVMYYTQAWRKASLLKEKARMRNNQEEIYISVETVLQEHAYVDSEIIYRFNTTVNAVNSKGKSIFKSKSRIPFTVYLNGEVTGKLEMGENDFYAFYLDGLSYAFEGTNQKVEKRYIVKPPAKHYQEFMSKSSRLYMELKGKTYMYGTKENDLNEVLSFSEFEGESTRLYFENQEYYVLDKYLIKNEYNSDVLLVGLKNADLIDLGVFYGKASGTIEVKKGDVKVGEFDWDKKGVVGKLYGNSYMLKWNEEYSAIEIWLNDELLFVSSKINDFRTIFASNKLYEKVMGDYFTIAFIYDYISALSQHIY